MAAQNGWGSPGNRGLRRAWLRYGLIYGAVALVLIGLLFPFYWMIVSAFQTESAAFSTHPQLWPGHFTLENFSRVTGRSNFLTYFQNSIIVSVSTTIVVVILACFGAYALARLHFKGRNAFGITLLLLQMFPAVLLVIPLFIMLTQLKLVNTYAGLILAYITGALPFTTWLLRGYFLSIPDSLEDSARIDGCTRIGALFRVVLPLAAPGLAAAAIFAFVLSWNEFLLAFILVDKDAFRTLSVGMSAYIDEFMIDYTGLMAMAVVISTPVIAIFMFLQKYLIGGLTAGAVTGE